MNSSEYIDIISTYAERVSHAARVAPDASVRACGNWRVLDVLVHLGEVHQFWSAIATSGDTAPQPRSTAERPSEVDMMQWYQRNYQQLVASLSALSPETPCWTWAGTQTIAWLTRRMAIETMLHAWDVMWAAGLRPELDPHIASDAIDEFLYVMTPLVREGQPVVGGSVHIHCTDVHGEWLVVPGDGLDMVVTREHAKGSVAMRGPAADILLVLWRRLPLEVVEVIGDASVAERFLLRADLD